MTAPDLAEQTKSTAPSSDAGLPPRPAEAPGQVAPTKRRQTWIGLQRAAQLSAIGIFVILLGAFLQAARVVVMPVASAIVIGLMLSPLARRASHYRIPPTISAILAVVFFLLLIQFALIAVAAPLITILNHAPDIADNIRQKLEAFDPILNGVRNLQAQIAPSSGDLGSLSLPKPDFASWASSVVGLLTPAAGEIVIFLATLFLYLISREQLRRNLILMASNSLARLRAIRVFNEVEEKLVRYIGTVAVINLVLGLLTALGTYLLGYPNPALLGALEFVCAFVPYLGAAFMLIVLALSRLDHVSGLASDTSRRRPVSRDGHLRRPSHHPQHRWPSVYDQPADDLSRACVLDLAVGAGRHVPVGPVRPHRGRRREPFLSRRCCSAPKVSVIHQTRRDSLRQRSVGC